MGKISSSIGTSHIGERQPLVAVATGSARCNTLTGEEPATVGVEQRTADSSQHVARIRAAISWAAAILAFDARSNPAKESVRWVDAPMIRIGKREGGVK